MKLKSWALIVSMAAVGIVVSGSIDPARAVTVTASTPVQLTIASAVVVSTLLGQ